MESFQMMYKSQFWKIYPYDWFCGPGSHIINKYITKMYFRFKIWRTLQVHIQYN